MQKRLAIAVAAVITAALPQFALAHTSNGQASARMDSKAFTHWESMGSAGPEPVQSVDAEAIPGAPNGMLAEMTEAPQTQMQAPAMTHSGNWNQHVTFFNKQGRVQNAPTHTPKSGATLHWVASGCAVDAPLSCCDGRTPSRQSVRRNLMQRWVMAHI
jgi:hypothetical protein